MKKRRFICAAWAMAVATATAQVDSTGWVDDMNRPLENGSDHYPRNAWDLHLWDGRIYVGWGNSASGGPSPNSNSVTILSFNPTTNQWVAEHQTNTCQVDVFRELDGQLVVPDHQSRDSGFRGGFYRLEPGGWVRVMTMGNMAHNYDMAFFEGKYYAVLGDSYSDTVPGPRMAFRASEDAGQTWEDPILYKGRLYTIFEFQGYLHALVSLGSGQYATLETRAGVTSYRYDLTGAAGFPGSTTSSKMHRPVVFNGRLLYLGGLPWNDHQTNPFDAFSAANLRPGAISVARIALPSNEKPWDFLVRGSKAYLLTSEKLATTPETFRVRVRESTDGIVFTELLRFTEWTFARSLELHNGYFYFGLGTDIGSDFATVLGPSYTTTRSPFTGYLRRVPADVSSRTTVVVDNSDATGVTLTGTWLTSTTQIGYIGANYIHDNNSGKGSRSVRFTPNLPLSGRYEVAIRYSTASSRATNVPVTITHKTGTASHSVNQTISYNGKWRVLGTYEFDAGTAGNVLVSNTGTTSFVTADAVAFRRFPDTGYAAWAIAKGLDGSPGRETGFTLDLDFDGLPNGVEAAVDGDPLAANPELLPKFDPATGGWSFTFRRNDTAESFVALICRWGATLPLAGQIVIPAATTGPDAQGISVAVVENGSAPDLVTVNFPAALAPTGSFFASLRSTLLVP